MLTEYPFKSLVGNYWTLCRRTHEALMWIHVVYMICFTYFVMPSNAWLHWRFGLYFLYSRSLMIYSSDNSRVFFFYVVRHISSVASFEPLLFLYLCSLVSISCCAPEIETREHK